MAKHQKWCRGCAPAIFLPQPGPAGVAPWKILALSHPGCVAVEVRDLSSRKFRKNLSRRLGFVSNAVHLILAPAEVQRLFNMQHPNQKLLDVQARWAMPKVFNFERVGPAGNRQGHPAAERRPHTGLKAVQAAVAAPAGEYCPFSMPDLGCSKEHLQLTFRHKEAAF